ncbi:MAG: GW dipeptide domain-containing protein [Bacteroidales bacterium]
MRKVKLLAVLFALIFSGIACQNSQNRETETYLSNGNHKVEVKEVIQATSYTYLRVHENGLEYWMAVGKHEIEEGAVLYYKDGLEMQNFESKDLNRTFDKIFFVQHISDFPIDVVDPEQQSVMGQTRPQKPTLDKFDVQVEPVEGGISIGNLYLNKANLEGQEVTVRGKVVKVNPSIMNRNWIHLQDGTGDSTHYDLTLTSVDIPKVGEIATYKGIVALDKDFTMGYFYELLLEEAVRIDDPNNDI